MLISMIAAMANDRIIGSDNAMPWHLPADLKHFKAVTIGKPVIMGRKTYESIGKALPGRMNIVISRGGFRADDVVTANSLDHAISLADNAAEIMVIGGGKIYEMFLPVANRLYLTFIDLETNGDTAFPEYNNDGTWVELSSEQHAADEKNPYNYRFVTMEKR